MNHVVFGKTGTLTDGKMSVMIERIIADSKFPAASLAFGLTNSSSHPVSAAVTSYLKAQGIEPAVLKDFRSVTGSGMEGTWNGINLRGGNSHWLSIQCVPEAASFLAKSITVSCLSFGEELIAVYVLVDCLRPDSSCVTVELQNYNITISWI